VPQIILRQLGKIYPNGSVGLGPIDLSITHNECFVLFGPSGSGKTTLLRLIAGLETPTSGQLEIDGVRSETKPPHQRGISFVTQRPALYPHLDVAENLAISLRFEQANGSGNGKVHEAEIQQRISHAAEILGLGAYLKRQVHELSGGEQRRVVLGRAIVAQRNIWLLDEPFSQLDSPLRDRLCGELHLLRRRLGLTIIHVTHDPNEAIALADRVGVLSEGRLLQAGNPEEVLSRPGNRTVAFCFGWPQINLIDGSMEPQSAGGSIFASSDGWCRVHRESRAHVGPATLGVRPEDVTLDRIPGWLLLGRARSIRAQPFVGNWLIDVETERGAIIRAVGPTRTPQENVELWADSRKLHWFDGDGKRIA